MTSPTEALARLVNPDAFRDYEQRRQYELKRGGSEEEATAFAEHYASDVRKALETARAILASGYALPAESGEYGNLLHAINGYAHDPMWANHAEVPKRILLEAARAISSLSAEKEAAEARYISAVNGRREFRAALRTEREEAALLEMSNGAMIGAIATHSDNQAAEIADLHAQLAAAREALRRIAQWEMPETGERWASGEPMSYAAAHGSDGEQRLIRAIATDALFSGAPR